MNLQEDYTVHVNVRQDHGEHPIVFTCGGSVYRGYVKDGKATVRREEGQNE